MVAEIALALDRDKGVVKTYEATGPLRPKAAKTSVVHAETFVRWLKGEFEPGARNQP